MPLPPPAGPPLRGRATSPCLGYPAPPQPQLPPTSSARLRAAPEVAGEAEELQAGGDGARRAPTQAAGRFLSQSPNYFLPVSVEATAASGGTLGSNVLLLPMSLGNKPSQGELYCTNPNTHNRTTTEKPKKTEDSPKSAFMEPSSGGVPRMLPTGAVPVFAEVSIGFYLQHILFSSFPCKAGASPLSKSFFFPPLPKDICSEG